MTLDEANAEAIRRIRAAKDCGQWWLDLGDLPIERVPDEIAVLSKQLRVLGLGKCEFLAEEGVWEWHEDRPGDIWRIEALATLTALTHLDLTECWDLNSVEPLRHLTTLTSLEMHGCKKLSSVEPLRNLTALTTLHLSVCKSLTNLEVLQVLTAIKKLGLAWFKSLTCLEPLRNLSALTTLDLSVCSQLKSIEPLRGLTTLTSLDLSVCTQLAVVEPLRNLTALNALYLSGCDQLNCVEPLRNLTALTELHLNGCAQLASVEPLRNFTALTSLDLSGCRAESFESLHELPSLKQLKVYRSRFPDLHSAVCGRDHDDDNLASVRAYFAALGPDAKPDAEIKVFVLGNGRCGKSYLIRRLTGMTWEQIEAAKIVTTHGVTIVSCPAPAEWGLPHPVTLSIWDFGGQDIYHGTHALFLREPAIYLLLYADATENEDTILDGGFEMHNRRLDYWFDYLRQEAGNKGVVKSPVLLIKSRSDEPLPEVPVSVPDAKAFPNITPPIRVSSKEPRGLRHLMPQLEDAIVGLLKEHPQPPLPASWAKVRERIREMQAARSPRTMTLDDLRQLCDESGCNEGDAPVLRDALALMGVVYYREGVFDDLIIVDQTWVLDAIYTLFKRDHKFQRKIDGQKGRFTREDLELFFWSDHPVEDQRTFLSFMEQCGICFRTRQGYDAKYEGEFVIPDKLDRWGADHDQQFRRQLVDAGGVEVTATFGLLHDGIARSFLSKIGSVAGDAASYWRYGCHFFDGKTNAEVLIRTVGNTVRIQTWGEKASELAQTLARVLKDVPCGQPPVIAWANVADQPTVIEREDRDQKPESKLDPTFGPKSVFFSYRHPNRDAPGSERGQLLLRELRALLEPAGWTVRFDERELQDGDSISGFIDDVRRCGFLVPVFCDRYLDSLYTLNELYTFRQRWGIDLPAFVARTVPVVYAESSIEDPKRQAAQVRRGRAMFEDLLKEAGDGALATSVYDRVKFLKSWNEQLSDLLAALNDRLNTPTAHAIADRLNRVFARLHPAR